MLFWNLRSSRGNDLCQVLLTIPIIFASDVVIWSDDFRLHFHALISDIGRRFLAYIRVEYLTE